MTVVQLENATVPRKNAAFRKCIEELDSAYVHTSGSHTSTPASPVNTPLDQPARSHLVDPVVSLTQLGDFTTDDARWAFSHSNNDVDVTTDILFSCPPVSSDRIRLDESQCSPSRGRGCAGHTFHPFRSSLSANSVPVQQSVPEATCSSVPADQLVSTLGKLTDVIDNFGTL
jgi:hypothetical protein